jgi:hypothetical protein
MRWLKRLFILVLVAAICAVIWFAFGIWSGMYSVYSFPPSKEHPDGATLIVKREGREPAFNSPDVKLLPPPPKEKPSGLTFETTPKIVRPVSERTILELPYIEWAYRKSLEP